MHDILTLASGKRIELPDGAVDELIEALRNSLEDMFAYANPVDFEPGVYEMGTARRVTLLRLLGGDLQGLAVSPPAWLPTDYEQIGKDECGPCVICGAQTYPDYQGGAACCQAKTVEPERHAAQRKRWKTGHGAPG